MPAMFESQQVGQVTDLADLISTLEVEACPFTSMIRKGKKPLNKVHHWQAQKYEDFGHGGVLDGLDAEAFVATNRKQLTGVTQKVWNNPAVSDFADEATIAGLSRGEMANQIAISMVNLKRIIERRGLSDGDLQEDNGVKPNETRGFFSWLSPDAQATYPVPEEFRTPASCVMTGELDDVTEEGIQALMEAGFIERKGPGTWDAFVGIKLKRKIAEFTIYQPDKTNYTAISVFRDVKPDDAKKLTRGVDFIEGDGGTLRLHKTSFNLTPAATGLAGTKTHTSGIALDMRMATLNYTRLPRVRRLEDKGGGPKAIVDAMFSNICLNPRGHLVLDISENS